MLRRVHASAQEGRKFGLERDEANQELSKLEAWLGGYYPDVPQTKNLLVRLNSPVDAALPFNIIVLELNMSKSIFQDLAIHEKLHHYIHDQMGANIYITAKNRSEIHDWIKSKSADMGAHYRREVLRNSPLPIINDYPSPQSWF